MSTMSAYDVLKVMIRTDRGSMTVWSPGEVRDALAAYRAAILDEAEAALTARHCSPESVDTVHRLINGRLCAACKGYGQVVEDTGDGGIVRRCRACNREGIRPMTASEANRG